MALITSDCDAIRCPSTKWPLITSDCAPGQLVAEQHPLFSVEALGRFMHITMHIRRKKSGQAQSGPARPSRGEVLRQGRETNEFRFAPIELHRAP